MFFHLPGFDFGIPFFLATAIGENKTVPRLDRSEARVVSHRGRKTGEENLRGVGGAGLPAGWKNFTRTTQGEMPSQLVEFKCIPRNLADEIRLTGYGSSGSRRRYWHVSGLS